VTGRGAEACAQRRALALGRLEHHAYVGPAAPGDGDRVVDREAVDDEHLVDPLGDPFQDMRQVALLVERRDHDRHPRHTLLDRLFGNQVDRDVVATDRSPHIREAKPPLP